MKAGSRPYQVSISVSVVLVVVLVLSGCAPAALAVQPPRAPDGLAGTVVTRTAADLALGRTDLPAGFQLAGDKSAGVDYVALYLRPAALEAEASGGNPLLSVLTSVGVYTTTLEAEQAYAAASGTEAKNALEAEAQLSKAATNLVSQPYEGATRGADAAEAFRVSYRILDQNIYEYGHRFRIGNVLAHVVVSAVGKPDEPAQLLAAARDIVQRQIDRIGGLPRQN